MLISDRLQGKRFIHMISVFYSGKHNEVLYLIVALYVNDELAQNL